MNWKMELTLARRQLPAAQPTLIVTLLGVALCATGLHTAQWHSLDHQYRSRVDDSAKEISQAGELNRLYDLAPPEIAPSPYTFITSSQVAGSAFRATNDSGFDDFGFNDDPVQLITPMLNMAGVVGSLLSLIAMVGSAAYLARERENGVLQLLRGNGCSLWSFIVFHLKRTAVWYGALSLVLWSVALGVALTGGLPLRFADVELLLGLSAGTTVYLTLCSALGIAIALKAQTVVKATLSSLLVWLLFCACTAIAGDLTKFHYRVISAIAIKDQIEHILGTGREAALNNEVAALQSSNNPALQRALTGSALTVALIRAKSDSELDSLVGGGASPLPAAARTLLRAEQRRTLDIVQQVSSDSRARAEGLQQSLSDAVEKKQRRTRLVEALAPIGAFSWLEAGLAGATIEDARRASTANQNYKEQVIAYVMRKAALQGGADPFNVRMNLADRPVFHMLEEGMAKRLLSAVPPLALLLLWLSATLTYLRAATLDSGGSL